MSKWFKEHKKTIGWIIILIGIVVACAINLLYGEVLIEPKEIKHNLKDFDN